MLLLLIMGAQQIEVQKSEGSIHQSVMMLGVL